MTSKIKCPGGCNSQINLKFKSQNNINLDNLNVRCTADDHVKPNLFKCDNCNLIFSEFINSNFLEKYTKVVDEKYVEQSIYKEKYFINLFEQIKSEINNSGNVLEIGSYYGVFANVAQKQIKNFHSVELSEHARKYAKENFNIDMVGENPIEYLQKRNNYFDNILMFDVIEHLDNPLDLLEKINESLKENGKFIFTTFDMDSLLPKIMGKNYQWIMPMHKFYFSKKTLNYYLNKNNLRIYKTLYDGRNVSVDYLLYKSKIFFPKFKFFFNFLQKFEFINKRNVNINFLDLKIFFVEKIK